MMRSGPPRRNNAARGITPSRFRDVFFEPGRTSPNEAIAAALRTRNVRARSTSVSDPPCASAICRLNVSPIPEPPGFVVKNGTNRFVGFIIPGPSSLHKNFHAFASFAPARGTPPLVSSDASTALCRMLMSNCSICAASASIVISGLGNDLNRKRVSRPPPA